MGCCICRVIWEEITEKYHGEEFGRWLQRHLRIGSFSIHENGESTELKLVRAFLSEHESRKGLYRLDFRLLDYSGSKRVATFLLEQTGTFMALCIDAWVSDV